MWSEYAIKDVEDIRDYIAQDNGVFAELFTERIITAVEKLEEFPQIGRVVPELDNERIREVLYRE